MKQQKRKVTFDAKVEMREEEIKKEQDAIPLTTSLEAEMAMGPGDILAWY